MYTTAIRSGFGIALTAFIVTTFESTAPAVEPTAAELAVKSQWDDEPDENLEPAPRAERASREYTWEQQHAQTDAKGGLVWTPKPFVFEAGDSVRYLDFEEGRDTNDGKTKSTAWKHHPWDGKATGRAASCGGIHTYVFKREVYYRSTLNLFSATLCRFKASRRNLCMCASLTSSRTLQTIVARDA